MITAIILAGGYGVRLRSLAANTAKPLLKVAGKPIIDFILEKLAKVGEVSEVIVSTNERFKDQFEKWLFSSSYKNVRIHAEPSRRKEEKLGAIKAIAELLPEVKNEHVMIVAGDNLFSSDLRGFVQYYREKQSPVLAVYDVKDPKLAREYSIVESDEDGRITRFEEKP